MKITHMMKAVAVAATLAVSTQGYAQTLQADLTQPAFGTMVFSDVLLSSLATASTKVTAIAPATATMNGTQVTGASAPLQSITLNATDKLSGTSAVVSSGGAMMTAGKSVFGAGGTLSVTGLGLDAVTGYVTANLSGGHGVANLTGVELFKINGGTYSVGGGSTSSYADNAAVIAGLASTSASAGVLTLTGGSLQSLIDFPNAASLSLNPTYQTYFQQALGLGALGLGVLQSIDNYGQITMTGTLKAIPKTVPEPSTYAVLGLGLAGLAFASRRRAK